MAAMFRFIVVGIAEMLLWLLCLIVSKSHVTPGPSSIENDAHGIEKFLLKTQVEQVLA